VIIFKGVILPEWKTTEWHKVRKRRKNEKEE